MTHLALAVTAALLHFFWQGTLLAALLWLALAALRTHSADLRYALCCSALLMMTALPVITTCTLLPRQGDPVAAATPDAGARPAPTRSGDPATGTLTLSPSWALPLQHWALPIWSLGVLFFSIRMIWGCSRVRSLRKRGESASPDIVEMIERLAFRLGLTTRLQVIVSTLTDSPSVIGWIRPAVLLPVSAITGLSPVQLEAILVHELAHIRRHDYLVNLMQMAVEALLFYHPAVWWISSQIRIEREFCCDDLAVRTSQDPAGYARALSALERLRATLPVPALGATGGPLLRRIERIISGSAREYGPSPLSVAVAMLLMAGAIGLNLGLLRGQENDPAGSVIITPRGVTIISQTPIDYPAWPKAAKVHRNVVVKLALAPDGTLLAATLVDPSKVSSPAPPELQQLVLESVRKWRFAAGNPFERAEDGSANVIVTFKAPDPPLSPAEEYLKQADTLARSEEYDKALLDYREAERRFPEKKLDILKRECEVYIRQNNQAAVRAKLAEIFQVSPNDAEARGLSASIRLGDGGNLNDIITDLSDVVRLIPGNFVAHFNLGRAWLAKGDLDQARKQFTAAIRIKPTYVPALTSACRIELQQGDVEAALQDGRLLAAIDSKAAHSLAHEILAVDPRNTAAMALEKYLNHP